MLGALIALMTVVAPSVADARNLVLIGAQYDTKLHAAMFLDVDTVRPMGENKRYWIYSGMREAGGGQAIAASLIEADCEQDRQRVLQVTFYKPDHSFDNNGQPESWSFLVPGTNNYVAMQVACGKLKQPDDYYQGDVNPFELIDRALRFK